MLLSAKKLTPHPDSNTHSNLTEERNKSISGKSTEITSEISIDSRKKIITSDDWEIEFKSPMPFKKPSFNDFEFRRSKKYLSIQDRLIPLSKSKEPKD